MFVKIDHVVLPCVCTQLTIPYLHLTHPSSPPKTCFHVKRAKREEEKARSSSPPDLDKADAAKLKYQRLQQEIAPLERHIAKRKDYYKKFFESVDEGEKEKRAMEKLVEKHLKDGNYMDAKSAQVEANNIRDAVIRLKNTPIYQRASAQFGIDNAVQKKKAGFLSNMFGGKEQPSLPESKLMQDAKAVIEKRSKETQSDVATEFAAVTELETKITTKIPEFKIELKRKAAEARAKAEKNREDAKTTASRGNEEDFRKASDLLDEAKYLEIQAGKFDTHYNEMDAEMYSSEDNLLDAEDTKEEVLDIQEQIADEIHRLNAEIAVQNELENYDMGLELAIQKGIYTKLDSQLQATQSYKRLSTNLLGQSGDSKVRWDL